MLKIEFVPWTEADLARINDLQDGGSIGAAQPSFLDLPAETRDRIIARMKIFAKTVAVNSKKVGRVHISPKPELKEIHIGYALYPEFRGKELIKPILRERIALFVRNEFPAIQAQFPDRELTAVTEATNIASVKTLEALGFTLSSKKMVPYQPESNSPLYESLIFKLKF